MGFVGLIYMEERAREERRNSRSLILRHGAYSGASTQIPTALKRCKNTATLQRMQHDAQNIKLTS